MVKEFLGDSYEWCEAKGICATVPSKWTLRRTLLLSQFMSGQFSSGLPFFYSIGEGTFGSLFMCYYIASERQSQAQIPVKSKKTGSVGPQCGSQGDNCKAAGNVRETESVCRLLTHTFPLSRNKAFVSAIDTIVPRTGLREEAAASCRCDSRKMSNPRVSRRDMRE